jgi:chemotaxis protein methyltransferase CheR
MEIGRGLTPAQLERHFHQEGTEWRIAENIRRQVEFFQLNLFDPWVNIPQCDIIFLRNVLIYFEVEKKRMLLVKIADVLKPNGYLLLGSAETTFGLDQSFERVPMGAVSFYRQANCL